MSHCLSTSLCKTRTVPRNIKVPQLHRLAQLRKPIQQFDLRVHSIRLLIDVDLPGLRFRRLLHGNGQNPILQASLDVFGIDTGREGEATVEVAHGTLRNPVFVLGLLGALISLGDLLVGSLIFLLTCGVLVLSSWFLVFLIPMFCVGNTARYFAARPERVTPLYMAFDSEGAGVGKLNVDVFLFDAGEFSKELVSFFVLADIELWSKGADGRCVTWTSAGGVVTGRGAVGVVVIEETEERAKVTSGKA